MDAADRQALQVTGRSPLSNSATGHWPWVSWLRLLVAFVACSSGGADSNAQDVSTFPETPRAVRRLDHSAPISLNEIEQPPYPLLDDRKTPIRRVSEAGVSATPTPRSQATVWAVLVGILGAAAALSYWSRRGGGPAHWKIPATVLQVLGRTQVGVNQSVTLLRLGERVLLVSSSGSSLQTLAVVTDPTEVATITAECLSKRSAQVASNLGGSQRRAPRPERDAHNGDATPVAGSIGNERVTRRRAGEREHA